MNLWNGLSVPALVIAASLVACTPTHNIKPLPNFINAGLAQGDHVTVTTRDGEVHEFVITEIRADSLVGANNQFALKEIVSIQKHAWKRPKSPCGGKKPLGCSIPLPVRIASDTHDHYSRKFHDACVQHDYCYGHGFASYGLDRKTCDAEFLMDMQNSCPSAPSSNLGRVFDVFDDSETSRQVCLLVANEFYEAVRHYGEDRFLTSSSTYCEYDGPPVGASRPTRQTGGPK